MGKMYDSLLSGTSGRTGRIVVANVFGNEITRIRPRKRTSQPTANQLLIQQRMKNCADFMQSYRSYACLHFGKRIGMNSCFNLAMTNLMLNFTLDYTTSTITIQYPNLNFSKGTLLTALPLAITLPTTSTLKVDWQDNSAGNPDRQNDWVQILVAAEGETYTSFYENAAQRIDATYTLPLPANFVGKTLHVYLAFRDTPGELVSNTAYAGSL